MPDESELIAMRAAAPECPICHGPCVEHSFEFGSEKVVDDQKEDHAYNDRRDARMITYGNTFRLVQEEERLRGEISDLTALLAEAIDLIRYPNDHDIASFLKRVANA